MIFCGPAWGAASGYREQLQKRNRMIRNKYAHGRTVSELADEYFLSLDSIKKILYSKKQADYAAYAPTIKSAVEYANGGILEEWMYCYWQLSKNASVHTENVVVDRIYFGVVKFPLRLIQRDEFDIGNSHVNVTEDHSALPPLIIEYHQGKFYCTEQKEILAGLIQHSWIIYNCPYFSSSLGEMVYWRNYISYHYCLCLLCCEIQY